MSNISEKREDISSARILAGLCSFLFPGLGQLLLDRIWSAAVCFIAFIVIWSVALGLIWNGFDNFSRLEILMGGLLGLTPHVLAAYLATHGHKFPSLGLPQEWSGAIQGVRGVEVDSPQGLEFNDYGSYQSWCLENGHEPMSLKQFDETFGQKD